MTHSEDSAELSPPQVQSLIQSVYPMWKLTDVSLHGSGLEFLVFRANTALYGQVAIRVPRQRWISNANDSSIDACDLLSQEAFLIQHFTHYHIPVPAFYALHLGDPHPFLVSELVEGIHDTPDLYQFGQLMRAIHDIPPLDFQPVMFLGQSLSAILAERIARRMQVVARLGGVSLPNFQLSDLAEQLQQVNGPSSILHMDARPANLLLKHDCIVAILDWSNALVGPPALDLARIAEYGYLNSTFMAGYEAHGSCSPVSLLIELIYRLDTAVMLAVVFLSETPDRELARLQIQRVIKLSTQLTRALP